MTDQEQETKKLENETEHEKQQQKITKTNQESTKQQPRTKHNPTKEQIGSSWNRQDPIGSTLQKEKKTKNKNTWRKAKNSWK